MLKTKKSWGKQPYKISLFIIVLRNLWKRLVVTSFDNKYMNWPSISTDVCVYYWKLRIPTEDFIIFHIYVFVNVCAYTYIHTHTLIYLLVIFVSFFHFCIWGRILKQSHSPSSFTPPVSLSSLAKISLLLNLKLVSKRTHPICPWKLQKKESPHCQTNGNTATEHIGTVL